MTISCDKKDKEDDYFLEKYGKNDDEEEYVILDNVKNLSKINEDLHRKEITKKPKSNDNINRDKQDIWAKKASNCDVEISDEDFYAVLV